MQFERTGSGLAEDVVLSVAVLVALGVTLGDALIVGVALIVGHATASFATSKVLEAEMTRLGARRAIMTAKPTTKANNLKSIPSLDVDVVVTVSQLDNPAGRKDRPPSP